MQKPLELKHSYKRNLIYFVLGSLVGIFIFFVPINGKLPFEMLYKGLIANPLGENSIYVILFITAFSLFGYIYAKTIAKNDSWFYKHFGKDSKFTFIIYLLAFAFTIMVVLQKGIPIFYSDKTAGMMIKDVLPFTLAIMPIGGLVLPLLTSFGLLELVGSLLEPIMRPAFKLPGKSAIDTIASIVGSCVMGIFLTSKLYHDNVYTEKEALSISTGFSLNSVGYCAFLIGYVGWGAKFGITFITYMAISYAIAALMVRIPPISRHKDVFKDGTAQTPEMRKESVKLSKAQIIKGYESAILKADSSESMIKDMVKSCIDGTLILTAIVPTMIAIAGIGLAIYEFTPIVDILSKPLIPFYTLLRIPEPVLAAKAVFSGGIELFLPSLMVTAGTTNMATRYFVVMISLIEVLYLTETILPIINFGIPVKFWELIVIWLERILITSVIMALLIQILF